MNIRGFVAVKVANF